jgi:hypothetical protein
MGRAAIERSDALFSPARQVAAWTALIRDVHHAQRARPA